MRLGSIPFDGKLGRGYLPDTTPNQSPDYATSYKLFGRIDGSNTQYQYLKYLGLLVFIVGADLISSYIFN